MEQIIEEEFSEEIEIMAEEEILDEETGKKQMCFKGILSEADSINGNRRWYPKSVLREVYNEAMERSKKTGKPIFGELEHAKDAHINLERIAVTFPVLEWDEEAGQIKGKAIPTLTEAGKTVEGLAKSGFPICFSTRMSGKAVPMTNQRKSELNIPLTEDVKEVLPGARLISIDVVGNNSCQKAISDTVYEEKVLEEEIETKKSLKDVIDQVF